MSNKPATQSLSALAPEQTGQKVFEEALRAAKEANYGAQRRQSKAKARARPRENVARARSSTPNKSHVRDKALELWSGVCDVSFRRIASSFPSGIGMGVKKMAKTLDSENLYASNEGVKAFSIEGFLRGGLFNALHRAIFFGGSPRKVEEAAMFLDQHGVVLGYSDKNLTALAQDPLPDPVEEAEARRQRRRQALKSWVEIWGRIEAPGRKALLAVCQNWLAEPFEEGGIEHGDWREAVARPGPAEELACRVLMIGQCASAFGSSLTASQWRSVLAEIVAVDNGFQQEEDARGRGFRFGLKKSLRLGLEQPGEAIDVESAGILAAIAVESDDIKLLGLVFERAERVGGLAPSNWWRFVADAEWVGSAENPNHNYQSRQNIHSSERWTSYVARAESWGGGRALSLLHLALVDSPGNRGGRKCFEALVQMPQMLDEAVKNPCPRIVAVRKTWEAGWLVQAFPFLGEKDQDGVGLGHYWTARWLDDTSLGAKAFKKAAKSPWAARLLDPMPVGAAPMGLDHVAEVMDGKTPFETAKLVMAKHSWKWFEKRAIQLERDEIASCLEQAVEDVAPRRSMRL